MAERVWSIERGHVFDNPELDEIVRIVASDGNVVTVHCHPQKVEEVNQFVVDALNEKEQRERKPECDCGGPPHPIHHPGQQAAYG